MMQWLRKRSPLTKVLLYAAAAALAFVLAAGAGAVGALLVRGDLALPGREAPRPPDVQQNAARPQEKQAAEQKGTVEHKQAAEQENAAKQGEAATQQDEAQYVSKVGEIQNASVEAFLASHERILVYDALTADDIEQMRANEAALQGLADQADNLDPPEKYVEHYEVFISAIYELHDAAQLAYKMAADPTAATQSAFDEYDAHVNKAAALLKRSNELLGQDYKTIEGVQEVSPLS